MLKLALTLSVPQTRRGMVPSAHGGEQAHAEAAGGGSVLPAHEHRGRGLLAETAATQGLAGRSAGAGTGDLQMGDGM